MYTVRQEDSDTGTNYATREDAMTAASAATVNDHNITLLVEHDGAPEMTAWGGWLWKLP